MELTKSMLFASGVFLLALASYAGTIIFFKWLARSEMMKNIDRMISKERKK